jgi:Cof subfamily protein (haloacid dehalogenase superfamily)
LNYSDFLIVTDVDGTLMRAELGISEKNLAAIRAFTEKGGGFTVATGREINVTKELLEGVPITAPSIHINGGYIYDWERQEILEPHYMPRDFSEKVRLLLDRYPGIDCHFATHRAVNLLTSGDMIRRYLPDREFYSCGFGDIPELVYKYIMTCPPEEMPEIRAFVEELVGNEADVLQSSPFFLELLPVGISKGKALRRVCELTGRSIQNCAAVGDYENDLEMIRTAGIGAAPENAIPAVKEAADYLLEPCEKDAIAELINILEERYIR